MKKKKGFEQVYLIIDFYLVQKTKFKLKLSIGQDTGKKLTC